MAIGTKVYADAGDAASVATAAADATSKAATAQAAAIGSFASAAQLVIAAGATSIDVTKRSVRCDGAAAGNFQTSALPDGTFVGQRIVLFMKSITALKTWIVTPAHFADGTTITFAVAGQLVELEWQVSGWCFVGGVFSLLA